MYFKRIAPYAAGVVILISAGVVFLYSLEIRHPLIGLIGACAIGASLAICFNTIARSAGLDRLTAEAAWDVLSWFIP